MSWRHSAKNAVACFVLGSLVSACSLSKNEAAKVQPQPEAPKEHAVEITESTLTFDSMFASASLKCENPNNCPGNVGLIVFPGVDKRGKPGFGRCTGTLIGEDLVLTAAHCIPESAKLNPSECDQQIGFIRSATDRFPRKIRCAEVIQYVNQKLSRIDYALIRLKEKGTDNPTRVSRYGIPDNTTLTTFVVDPMGADGPQKPIRGLMKKRTCKSIMYSMIEPGYLNPLSNLIAMTGEDCILIGGNSGSSLIADDEIRGIVTRGREFADTRQILRGKDFPMSAGVNLACLNLQGFPAVSRECLSVPSDDIYDELKTTDGILHHSANAIEEVTSRAPLFRYKVEIVSRKQRLDPNDDLFRLGQHEYLRTKVAIEPTCVVSRAHWSTLGVRVQTDENGRQVILYSAPTEADLNITLVLDEMSRYSVQARMINVNERPRAIPVSSLGYTIPWCGPVRSISR